MKDEIYASSRFVHSISHQTLNSCSVNVDCACWRPPPPLGGCHLPKSAQCRRRRIPFYLWLLAEGPVWALVHVLGGGPSFGDRSSWGFGTTVVHSGGESPQGRGVGYLPSQRKRTSNRRCNTSYPNDEQCGATTGPAVSERVAPPAKPVPCPHATCCLSHADVWRAPARAHPPQMDCRLFHGAAHVCRLHNLPKGCCTPHSTPATAVQDFRAVPSGDPSRGPELRSGPHRRKYQRSALQLGSGLVGFGGL